MIDVHLHKKPHQSGFTLIELMIVVAIIGILAAIAIPMYQDYAAKAQASEARVLLGGLKTPVQEYYFANGTLPTLASMANTTRSGRYVSSITSSITGTVVSYKATFRSTGVADTLKGKVVTLEFDTSTRKFEWKE